MEKTYVDEILDEKFVGSSVSVSGWVYRKREMKDKIFLVLRDSTNIVQCIIRKDKVPEETWEKAHKLQIEGSLKVIGKLKKDERAPTGYEIEVERIEVFDFGDIFPLKGDEKPDAILSWRHLWIRNRKFAAITKIRHSLTLGMIDYFVKSGWYYVFPPVITPTAGEDTTELFEIKYFNEKAYLSQTAQLYLEAMIFSLEKVFSLTPSFRAEMSRTKRHLHEYWHLEGEAAWMKNEDMMDFVEALVKAGLKKVVDERIEELKLIGRDPEQVKEWIKKPFKRIKYSKAIELLKEKGIKIEYGEDLGADEERELTLMFDVPIFVTNYPREIKAFYMKEVGDGTVANFDLLAPEGYGEIVGGSERETDYELLIKKMKEFKLKPENYKWYLDLRKYGSVPHSGFGLGVDRTVRWIAKVDHVRDTLPFPRLRGGWLEI